MLFVDVFTKTSFRPTSGPYDIIYGKQRVVRNFEVGDSVSIAVLALDRASKYDKLGESYKSTTAPATRLGPNTAY